MHLLFLFACFAGCCLRLIFVLWTFSSAVQTGNGEGDVKTLRVVKVTFMSLDLHVSTSVKCISLLPERCHMLSGFRVPVTPPLSRGRHIPGGVQSQSLSGSSEQRSCVW